MRRAAACLPALVWALPAAAAPASAPAETDPAVREVMERLADAEDPLAEALAARLDRSRLSAAITRDSDPAARRKALRDWIASDPSSAARLALGLAQDDADGGTAFEDGIARQARLEVRAAPGADRTVFGRLSAAARDSGFLKRQADELSEEERREIVRTLFEGQGAQEGRVLEGKAGEDRRAKGGGSGASPSASFAGFYDRLSAANLRGYSPQLLAFQNELNRLRPPGAPALIETGKLDHATLSFPEHAMRFDLDRLHGALKSRLDAAAAAGRSQATDAERDWAGAITRAAHAVDRFRLAAMAAKDPAGITKELLRELGARQREAARRLAAAALLQERAVAAGEAGFITPELRAAIDAAPVPADVRAAYHERGRELEKRLAETEANAAKAAALLESDSWEKSVAEAERLRAANRRLRAGLGPRISLYVRVPFDLLEAGRPKARWRELLDSAVLRWAPRTRYGRAVESRRGRIRRSFEEFSRIAASRPAAR